MKEPLHNVLVKKRKNVLIKKLNADILAMSWIAAFALLIQKGSEPQLARTQAAAEQTCCKLEYPSTGQAHHADASDTGRRRYGDYGLESLHGQPVLRKAQACVGFAWSNCFMTYHC